MDLMYFSIPKSFLLIKWSKIISHLSYKLIPAGWSHLAEFDRVRNVRNLVRYAHGGQAQVPRGTRITAADPDSDYMSCLCHIIDKIQHMLIFTVDMSETTTHLVTKNNAINLGNFSSFLYIENMTFLDMQLPTN